MQIFDIWLIPFIATDDISRAQSSVMDAAWLLHFGALSINLLSLLKASRIWR